MGNSALCTTNTIEMSDTKLREVLLEKTMEIQKLRGEKEKLDTRARICEPSCVAFIE